MTWISLDITMETISAQGTDKQDFINLLNEVENNWKGTFKLATDTVNNAEKTAESSRQLQIFLIERSKEFEKKFNQLKNNQSQTGISGAGPGALGATPPKKPRFDGENSNNS